MQPPDYPPFYRLFLELDFPGDWNAERKTMNPLRWIFVIAVAVWLAGCAGCAHGLPPTTRTQFAPPTTAPSVTPAARSALAYAQTVDAGIADASTQVFQIDNVNLDIQREAALLSLKSTARSCKALIDTLQAAVATSMSADNASKTMAKERDDARSQVHTLEDDGAKKDKIIADQKIEIKDGKAKADAAIRSRNILIASIVIGGAVAFGIYEAGCGLVVSLIVGALAFAAVPIVATSLWFQIVAGVAAVVVVAFAIEVKFKGGFAAALHDKFKPSPNVAPAASK
jgi:hypothetical protein